MDTVAPDTERAGYVAGLRGLADLLEAHPEVPLPANGQSFSPMQWVVTSADDQRADLAVIARALPGRVEKEARDDSPYFKLRGRIAGLHLTAYADRDEVCTATVVGEETVTRTVPDPAAPMVEVTETRNVVQWRCEPLMADREPVEVAP